MHPNSLIGGNSPNLCLMKLINNTMRSRNDQERWITMLIDVYLNKQNVWFMKMHFQGSASCLYDCIKQLINYSLISNFKMVIPGICSIWKDWNWSTVWICTFDQKALSKEKHKFQNCKLMELCFSLFNINNFKNIEYF